MKKILISLVALVTLSTYASAVSFSWLSSKVSGGGTISSTSNEVEAHGWYFRSYTYLDTAGRVCTVIFTDQKGGTLDCEFPPKDFDYDEFQKRANK